MAQRIISHEYVSHGCITYDDILHNCKHRSQDEIDAALCMLMIHYGPADGTNATELPICKKFMLKLVRPSPVVATAEFTIDDYRQAFNTPPQQNSFRIVAQRQQSARSERVAARREFEATKLDMASVAAATQKKVKIKRAINACSYHRRAHARCPLTCPRRQN